MSVDSFIKEWEKVSTVGNAGKRVFGNVEARLAVTGWDNTVKVQGVRSLTPKQGNATALFKKLTALAKAHNITLRLTAQNMTPWKQGSMNRGEIVRWLNKNGFKRFYEWPDGFGTEMVTR